MSHVDTPASLARGQWPLWKGGAFCRKGTFLVRLDSLSHNHPGMCLGSQVRAMLGPLHMGHACAREVSGFGNSDGVS